MKKYKVSRQRAYWCTETAIIEAEDEDKALDEFFDGGSHWVEIDDVFTIGGDTYEREEEVREFNEQDSFEDYAPATKQAVEQTSDD
jgi:hypothetical protein